MHTKGKNSLISLLFPIDLRLGLPVKMYSNTLGSTGYKIAKCAIADFCSQFYLLTGNTQGRMKSIKNHLILPMS